MYFRSRLPALALVLVLSAPACSDDDPTATTTPPPTTTAPSTTLSQTAQDEAELRELADEWFETIRLILAGEQSFDAARDFVIGGYLNGFRQQLDELESSGRSIRLDPADRSHNETTSVDLDGDEAAVFECIVDGDYLIAPDGSVLNDDVTARLVRTTATRTDDGWRFTNREGLTEAIGSDQCEPQ